MSRISMNDEIGYRSWQAMKSRCYNPTDRAYKDYGGRGIEVCDRWRYSFENFLEDMGHKPSSKHTLERIDNDWYYEPGNCYWATRREQSCKLTEDYVYNIRPSTLPASVLAIEYDMAESTIYNIIAYRIWKDVIVPANALPKIKDLFA
jgi:hypothetical protein